MRLRRGRRPTVAPNTHVTLAALCGRGRIAVVRKILATLSVLSSLIVSLGGCRETTAPPLQDLLPLTRGAFWVYRFSYIDSAGQVARTAVDTQHVFGDTTIGGATWYAASRSPILGTPLGRGFVANRAGGLWFTELSSDSVHVTDVLHLYFRYPARVGDTHMPDETTFLFPLVVTATDEPCETPQRNARCIRYEERVPSLVLRVFHVAPGIGLVAIDSPEFDFDLDSLGQLRSLSRRVALIDVHFYRHWRSHGRGHLTAGRWPRRGPRSGGGVCLHAPPRELKHNPVDGMQYSPLSPETQRRLDVLFVGPARRVAGDLLVTQCGGNLPLWSATDPAGLERIRFAALKLSNGDLAELRRAVDIAQSDWRDVLVTAGFGRDPRAHERWFPNGPAP